MTDTDIALLRDIKRLADQLLDRHGQGDRKDGGGTPTILAQHDDDDDAVAAEVGRLREGCERLRIVIRWDDTINRAGTARLFDLAPGTLRNWGDGLENIRGRYALRTIAVRMLADRAK